MTQHEAQLNGFLVNVFNDILRLEEASIRKGAMQKPLCFRDACAGSRGKVVCRRIRRSGHGGGCRTSFHHLRHAECGCQNAGAERISRPLRGSRDKRRVTVALTPAARSALESHAAFHETLVARAAARLSEAEIAALSTALASLHAFFAEL